MNSKSNLLKNKKFRVAVLTVIAVILQQLWGIECTPQEIERIDSEFSSVVTG